MSSSETNVEPSWTTLGNATCLSPDNPLAVWPYCPSEAAAVLFALLFLATTVANFAYSIKFRTIFPWVLIMGASWEFAGFVVRALGTRFQQSLAMYAIQLILILLAPLWINAFVYMLFARMVYYFDPDRKIGFIPATKLGPTLIGLDVATFLVQLLGVIMLTSTDINTLNTGKNVYMIGIGIQQTLIVCFLCFVIRFHMRVSKRCEARSTHYNPTTWLIYLSLFLITVRIIFRFAEYSQGFASGIARTESYQYIFDAVPMLNATLIWAIWHPGRVLKDRDGLFPTRKEKKARKQILKAQKEAQKNELKGLQSEKKGSKLPWGKKSASNDKSSFTTDKKVPMPWKKNMSNSVSSSTASLTSTARSYSPQPPAQLPNWGMASYIGADYAESGHMTPHAM